jgi:hypothetical protein
LSVTFTYDKLFAEHLAEQWKHVAPVKIGGVAYGDRGEEFVPGRYIRPGYVFTSRGCPRRCWFCSVWKRDPVPRIRRSSTAGTSSTTICSPDRAITSSRSLPCCGDRIAASSSLAAWRRSRYRTIRSNCSQA